MKKLLPYVFAALLAMASFTYAQMEKKTAPPKAPSGSPAHLMVAPDAVKWGPPAAEMLVGTPAAEFANEPLPQFAVIAGAPSKPGAPYVIRVKTTDGALVAPHWHPGDENITVLQGTFTLGMGKKFDRGALRELPAGSYAFMPKRTPHFASSKSETIVQVHGIGPFQVVWVNPAAAQPAKSGKYPGPS